MRVITIPVTAVTDGVMAADALAAGLDRDTARPLRVIGYADTAALARLVPFAAAAVAAAAGNAVALGACDALRVVFEVADTAPADAAALLEAAVTWQLLATAHAADKTRHAVCTAQRDTVLAPVCGASADTPAVAGTGDCGSIVPRWW